MWQLSHPFLRFTSPIVNDLTGFALAVVLPWSSMVAVFRIGRWWSKAAAIASILPLLLYSWVFLWILALTGSTYKNGRDLSFDQFAATNWKGSEVRFYRADNSPIGSDNVIVRQVRPLLPGLLLVRTVDILGPCYSLGATATDYGIAITGDSFQCPGFTESRREYRLRPFIYF